MQAGSSGEAEGAIWLRGATSAPFAILWWSLTVRPSASRSTDLAQAVTRLEQARNDGSRRRGTTLLALLTAALAALMLAPAALAKDMVFWVNFDVALDDTISKANLDGSGGGSDLNIQGTTVGNALGIAIDASTGKIYWADSPGDQIKVANLDGSGGSLLNVTGVTVESPRGIAIDPGAGKIYFSNGTNAIVGANLDGSDATTLDTTGATVSSPYGVAIDPANGKIYWSNFTSSAIGVANLDGSGGADDLDTTGATVNSAAGIAVDAAAGKVYWANSTGFGTLSGANADGSGSGFDLPVTFPPVSVEAPTGIALDPASGRIYWGNRNGGGVAAADLDGSDASFLNASGATVSNATYPVLLKAPVAGGLPEVSSAAAVVGGELRCSAGQWAPDLLGAFLYRAPQSFAYEWLRDSTEIPGATSGTHTPGQAGSYSCRVGATNEAGTTSQTSGPIEVEEGDTTVEGSAGAKKTQKQKGNKIVIKVKVKAEEDLKAKATGKVKVNPSYKLKPQSKSVSSGKKKTLKLKPKKSKDAKKIAKALKKGKKATAKLKVKLTDQAGNKKTEKLKVKLKR